MDEWAWHYAVEWNINNLDEMVADLTNNYSDDTFVALDCPVDGQEAVVIGTVALLDSDLRSHLHLACWVTCLWVAPEHRRTGIGKQLVDHAVSIANTETVHLWCYTTNERDLYGKWGFQLIERIQYDGKDAYVMAKTR